MEDHRVYSATLASFTVAVPTIPIILAAGIVLHVVMVAVVIREFHLWGRDMDKRATRWEREHQEYMVSRIGRAA
ncbi:MAG: hypothetical protein OXF07_10960 [Rhodobacter sp.]|nr:hypothetical protein [Rhodobacter sp.]MCY4242893.1 hypothetical protein [Rhodobacter sp.]